MNNKGNSSGWIILIIMIILLVIGGIYFFSHRSQVCGTHTETYTSNVKGCDSMQNCRCLHYSWAGLGACDSCECSEEVSNC